MIKFAVWLKRQCDEFLNYEDSFAIARIVSKYYDYNDETACHILEFRDGSEIIFDDRNEKVSILE